MERFIGVDAGKYATKAAEYNTDKDGIHKDLFETKTAPGDFRDDAIEHGTCVAEIDGVVYKIGHGARGDGTVLETSKQTETHRLCTLLACADFCSDDETDDVYLATGLPAKEWAVVAKREEYKAFYPRENIEIRIKKPFFDGIHEKHFNIKQIFVFPESIGATLMDDSPEISETSLNGVIDIGNLNVNATLWQGTELIQDDSITDELGAATIISGLAQELSANFSRVSERMVASILTKQPDYRYLPGDNDIREQSKKFIHDYLLAHTEKIKRCCDARKWSLDFMNLIAIGGTSLILRNELEEVFGQNIHFLSCPAFANAYGYLRLMCSRLPQIGKVISLQDLDKTA